MIICTIFASLVVYHISSLFFLPSLLRLLTPSCQNFVDSPISSYFSHSSLVFAAATFGFLPNHLILCKFSYCFLPCCFIFFSLISFGFARAHNSSFTNVLLCCEFCLLRCFFLFYSFSSFSFFSSFLSSCQFVGRVLCFA